MPITVFVAPGPMEVNASIGRPRGAVEAVGKVHRGLLVHDLHGADLGPVEEGIGQRPDPVAGDAGGMRDPGAHEVFGDDLRPGEALHGVGGCPLASIRYHANDYIAAL